MKLYAVHCGFYDKSTGDGVYESHINFYVVAESFASAKQKAKQDPRFIDKKMHVDGLQEIAVVNGYQIQLVAQEDVTDSYEVRSLGYDELKTLKTNPSTNA